jgi:hypothetical protein
MRAILTSVDQSLKNLHSESEKQAAVSERLLKLLIEKLGRLSDDVVQQTSVLEDKLGYLSGSIANLTGILNDKLSNLHEGMAHQTSLLNDKLGSVHKGIAHQTSLLNDKLGNLHEGMAHQTSLLNDKLGDLRDSIASLTNALSEKSAVRAMPEGETSDPAEWRLNLIADLKRFHTEALRQLTTLNVRVRDLQEKLRIASAGNVPHAQDSELENGIPLGSQFRSVTDFAVSQIPFPVIRLDEKSSLVTILESSEFRNCAQFFVGKMADCQLPGFAVEQAFFFSLVRNLRPEHVFEIGWHRGVVTEAMCRALQANGTGLLHLPAGGVPDRAGARFDRWMTELRPFVRVHATDELGFLEQMRAKGVTPELIVLNGLRDTELTVVMETASVVVKPTGLVVIADIEQAGTRTILRDFLSHHPEWASNNVLKPPHCPDPTELPHLPVLVGLECAVLRAP